MDLQFCREFGPLALEGSFALFPHHGELVLHPAVILKSLTMSDTFGD